MRDKGAHDHAQRRPGGGRRRRAAAPEQQRGDGHDPHRRHRDSGPAPRPRGAGVGRAGPRRDGRPSQCGAEVRGGLEAARGGLGHRAAHGGVERRRDLMAAGAGPRHGLGEVLRGQRQGRGPGVGRLPGQHLVQGAAEGVDVGAVVERRVGGGLLRAHVLRRPERDADGGDRGVRPRPGHGAGDPEVRDDGVALGEEDVLRLDVPMHDAPAVGVGEAVGRFGGDPHRLRDGQRPFARQAPPQRVPLDERHHVVEQAVGFAGVVQRKDVRVVELRRDVDLAEEALQAQEARQLREQHLDRHRAVVAEVVREEHHRHPAPAQPAFDPVAPAEGRGQPSGDPRLCVVAGRRQRDRAARRARQRVRRHWRRAGWAGPARIRHRHRSGETAPRCDPAGGTASGGIRPVRPDPAADPIVTPRPRSPRAGPAPPDPVLRG